MEQYCKQRKWPVGCAHDFSNYLTSILGFAELAVQDLPPEAPARAYMLEVWQAARSGAGWAQRLSFLGRPKPKDFQPTDIVALVKQEARRLRHLWKKTVSFRTSFGKALPMVAMENEALLRVLTELLENSRESITAPGTVTLTVRGSGTWVEIAVSDTGCGLSPLFCQEPFPVPFFSTKPGHRGLGLLIVLSIIQQYDGELQLKALPNLGTRAHVLLPATSAAS